MLRELCVGGANRLCLLTLTALSCVSIITFMLQQSHRPHLSTCIQAQVEQESMQAV
jgi:hypothetical protein